MGVPLISEKLFCRSSFYGIAYFSILATGSPFDPTNTSENVLLYMGTYLQRDPLYGYLSCSKGLFQ